MTTSVCDAETQGVDGHTRRSWFLRKGLEPIRVCYFGTFRANYSRNRIMIEGLRRAGVQVVVCHETLWHGIGDRVRAASGGWLDPGFVVRVVRTYWHLLRAYVRVGDYDVMVLGYPGQFDVLLARILTWLRRRPLVMDVFMSVYLIAMERGLTGPHPFTSRLIHCLERLACVLPDRLLLDTAEYVQWFSRQYGLDPDRFRLVPTGADDTVFEPVSVDRTEDQSFRVLYYGTFIRNHGVEFIIEAANLLRRESEIRFDLVGDGPTRTKAEELAGRYGLPNVSFTDWMERPSLLRRIGQADLCLGAFGTTPQSVMTVQNKIYEGLAMAKPVITGDAPAVRASLDHGRHLYLCERADPEALAQAILVLRSDPALREKLSAQGHDCFRGRFSTAAIGKTAAGHLAELLCIGTT